MPETRSLENIHDALRALRFRNPLSVEDQAQVYRVVVDFFDDSTARELSACSAEREACAQHLEAEARYYQERCNALKSAAQNPTLADYREMKASMLFRQAKYLRNRGEQCPPKT